MSTDTRPCLGIETSGVDTGAALVRDGRVLAERREATGTGHNERLLALIELVMNEAGTRLADLAGIGVTIGPGMFTSLRVGLATAKGLAVAGNVPLKGIGTLRALADSVGQPDRPVLALVDARKQQVYAALYRGERALLEPAVLGLADVGPAVRGLAPAPGVVVLAGSGAALCAEGLRAAGVSFSDSGISYPAARVVALRAAALLADGPGDDIETLEPAYLRRTDAELNREAKSGAGRG